MFAICVSEFCVIYSTTASFQSCSPMSAFQRKFYKVFFNLTLLLEAQNWVTDHSNDFLVDLGEFIAYHVSSPLQMLMKMKKQTQAHSQSPLACRCLVVLASSSFACAVIVVIVVFARTEPGPLFLRRNK